MRIMLTGKSSNNTENMGKILDQWARHYCNTYGGKRLTSYNAPDGFTIHMAYDINLDRIINGVLTDIVRKLDKPVTIKKLPTVWLIMEEEGE